MSPIRHALIAEPAPHDTLLRHAWLATPLLGLKLSLMAALSNVKPCRVKCHVCSYGDGLPYRLAAQTAPPLMGAASGQVIEIVDGE